MQTYTIQALAGQGEHIVAQKTIYGKICAYIYSIRNYNYFRRFHNLQEVEDAIQENTKAIYLETLGNPNSDILDIDAISAISKKHGLPVVVDNTFGTPYLFRPIEHGADIVVHSATKFIGGHGTSLGGVIVDGGTYDWAKSGHYPWISEPNPSYHGVKFTEAAGPAASSLPILFKEQFLHSMHSYYYKVQKHYLFFIENTKKVLSSYNNIQQ